MNEKDIIAQINDLTKLMERQTDYAEQLNSSFISIQRILSSFAARIERLENLDGYKNKDE